MAYLVKVREQRYQTKKLGCRIVSHYRLLICIGLGCQAYKSF